MEDDGERAVLVVEADDTWEDSAIFSALNDGRLAVSVAQEHAVDSYNETFTCVMHLSGKQALVLRDWMDRHFRR